MRETAYAAAIEETMSLAGLDTPAKAPAPSPRPVPGLSKPELVARHLLTIGRITDATARATYGTFRLADAVYRLRSTHRHLLPEGTEIITNPRYDLAGNLFAEYRLVKKDPAQ